MGIEARLRSGCTWLALLVGMPGAMAHTQTEPQTLSQLDAPQVCVSGFETILPGVYYACQAKVSLKEGHTRAAVRYLSEAAYWGDKPSQFMLGVANFNGELGLPRDRALGLVWMGLAAERRQPPYVRNYLAAKDKMSASELTRATRLWKTMWPRYGDPTAARRAQRVYAQYIARIRDMESVGGTLLIRGLTPSPWGGTDADGPPAISPSVGGAAALSVEQVVVAQAKKEFAGLEPRVIVGQVRQVLNDDKP